MLGSAMGVPLSCTVMFIRESAALFGEQFRPQVPHNSLSQQFHVLLGRVSAELGIEDQDAGPGDIAVKSGRENRLTELFG